MSRAVLFLGAGKTLETARFPAPEPCDSEIVVRVCVCTLCGSDLHTYAGRRTVEMPTVLGHEIVGRIEAFGPNASRFDFRGARLDLGSRVSWSVAAACGKCYFCLNELPQKCAALFKFGHQRFNPDKPFTGGLADLVVLPPGSAIFRVPDSLRDEVAASANCATATAASVLRAGGDVAGRCVLIFGAGMLGLSACAMARSAGARNVIVSDPDPSRRQRALAFGATQTASADPNELTEIAVDATLGRGADLVLELAGASDAVTAGLAATRVGGTIVLAGTVMPTPPITLDPESVVRKCLTIRGVHNYAPRDLAAALDFLAGVGSTFPFASLVSQTVPLADVEAAFQLALRHPGERIAVVP